MENQPIDPIGYTLIGILLSLLLLGGYLSYKSIDFDVLKKLEAAPLILPTPIPTAVVSNTATPSAKPTK